MQIEYEVDSSGDSLRSMPCLTEAVACFTVTDMAALWCTMQGRLYVWDRRSEDDPCMVAEIGWAPDRLAVTSDQRVVVLANQRQVGVYVMNVEHNTEDDYATVSYSYSFFEVYVAKYSLEQVLDLALSPDASLAAICTPSSLVLLQCSDVNDGSVHTRESDLPPFLHQGDEERQGTTSNLSTRNNHCLPVTCNAWYGEPGAALALFASPERLLLVSSCNHIVAVTPDWAAHDVVLARDGHVLSQVHRVTCMASSSVRDNVLAVGLSDGTVRLLQLDSLQTFKTIDAVSLLLRMVSFDAKEAAATALADLPWQARKARIPVKSGSRHNSVHRTGASTANRAPPSSSSLSYNSAAALPADNVKDLLAMAFEALILSIAIGHKYISIALPDAVIYVDRDSYLVYGGKTFFMKEDVGIGRHPPLQSTPSPASSSSLCMKCAPGGSWMSWEPFSAAIDYYVAATILPKRVGVGSIFGDTAAQVHGGCGRTTEEDVVHAQIPLPEEWLTPLLLPSSSALVDVGSSGSALVGPGARGRGGAGSPASRFSRPQLTVDRPVTFGHRIRSSGYSEVPWSVQQARTQAARARAKAAAANPLASGVGVGSSTMQCKTLAPYEAHRFTAMSAVSRVLAQNAAVHTAAVLSAAFTSAGDALVTGSGDASAFFLKYPVAKHMGDGFALRSHKLGVLSVDTTLSLKGPLVGTSSADGTIRLWRPTKREASYLSHTVQGASEVRAVRFFYLDRLLAYARGSAVELCKYAIDDVGGGDLNRVRNESCVSRPVFSYSTTAQYIAAMDCINHFASSLVVLAGSNKEVTVLDVAAQVPIWSCADAHSRAIHHVSMCRASRFATGDMCTLSAQHSFLTAGLDGAVNLWDLRQPHAVRHFALHSNKALASVGLCMGPTGTTFAVGSEDRAVYVYDVRNGGVALDVLRCGETPTAIAWHPVDPVMAVGLSTGAITFFGQR